MTDPRKLSFPRLAVQPRETTRHVLRNGIVVHLLEDHTLPVVNLGLLVRAGTVHDPADRAGLGSMTSTAMRLGGSRLLPGDALDEELDHLGASLDPGMDDESFHLFGWSLARHLPRMAEIMASLLREPAFPPDKVELTRLHELEMIQRRWDTPQQVASLMYRRAVYGLENPWGRLGNAAQAKAVTREEMIALHRSFCRPGAMILAAAGDFDSSALLETLNGALGDWSPGPAEPAPVPDIGGALPPGVYLVPREIGQANLRIGHLSIRQGDPDHFALKLMDMVLGNGTFNSRLFRDIRTKRGLAYSIWSRVNPRPMVPGTFTIGGETKYEALHEAIDAILGHIRALRATEATDAEVKLAKDQLDHGLAFEFQSSWEVAWRSARYEYDGLPANWLLHEREQVLAATKAGILAAAKTHLHPESLVVIAVGDPAKCRTTLEKFGAVREFPIPDTAA
ncbi:MAG: pitrilysin family protein [Candidatus Coatesbacteria bacterium]